MQRKSTLPWFEDDDWHSARPGFASNAKLSEGDVKAIRARSLAERPVRMHVIAAEYSVSPQTIRNIVTWKTWRNTHLDDEFYAGSKPPPEQAREIRALWWDNPHVTHIEVGRRFHLGAMLVEYVVQEYREW